MGGNKNNKETKDELVLSKVRSEPIAYILFCVMGHHCYEIA